MKKLLMTALLTSLPIAGSQALSRVPLVDSQPTATEGCPITNTSHTENADGSAINVRNYECIVEGRNVVWSVTVPLDCEAGGCGLIVDIHGAGMNANVEDKGTKLRQFGWKAMERGATTPYIIIQPSFSDIFDEELIFDIESIIGGAYMNEMPGIHFFINDAIDAFAIDQDRVHMHGFSRGASTTSTFYCDEDWSDTIASFATSGGGVSCALNNPLMLMSGLFDPGKTGLNDALITEIKGKGAYTESTIYEDENWQLPAVEFNWSGMHVKGKHQDVLYTSGDYVFRSVKHSAKTYPTLGHCHPSSDYSTWLACYSTMESGEKLIDFFIANPRQ